MPKFQATWRLGLPQVFAGLLLLAFAAQCFWLVTVKPQSGGLEVLSGPSRPGPVAWLLTAAAGGFVRVVWIAFGVLRGAAIWYVARRLYGNAGGYVALALYCFSARMVRESVGISPEAPASWGFFGVIFVAIALAHTLYAPLRNRVWRTLLLGISLTLAFGSQYSAGVAVIFAAGFMLYLAPEKRRAALLALAGSVGVAGLLVWAAGSESGALGRVRILGFEAWGITPLRLVAGTNAALLRPYNSALLAMLAISLVTFVTWKRARYFGNAAPFLVATTMFAIGYFMPSAVAWEHLLKALPFAFVFVGGMFADLLETRYRAEVVVLTVVLLASHAALGLAAL